MADSQHSRKPRRSGPVPGTPAGGDRVPQSPGFRTARQERLRKVGEDLTHGRKCLRGHSQEGRMSSVRPTVCSAGAASGGKAGPQMLCPNLSPRYELLNAEYSGPKNTTSRLCSHILEPTNPSSPKSTSGTFQELCPGSTLPEASSWVPDQS